MTFIDCLQSTEFVKMLLSNDLIYIIHVQTVQTNLCVNIDKSVNNLKLHTKLLYKNFTYI